MSADEDEPMGKDDAKCHMRHMFLLEMRKHNRDWADKFQYPTLAAEIAVMDSMAAAFDETYEHVVMTEQERAKKLDRIFEAAGKDPEILAATEQGYADKEAGRVVTFDEALSELGEETTSED